jgi:hypothetical protein
MKRKVFAGILAIVGAAAVFFGLTLFGAARGVVLAVATLPLSMLVGVVLPWIGVDATAVKPLMATAFLNWLLLGYALGGIVFRDKTIDTNLTR